MLPNPLYKQGKLRTQLLPTDALIETAKAFEQGACSYGPRNWEEEGKQWSDVYGALLRHSFAWFNGEDTDTESKVHHMAHASACTLMLLAMSLRKLGIDDRIVYENPKKTFHQLLEEMDKDNGELTRGHEEAEHLKNAIDRYKKAASLYCNTAFAQMTAGEVAPVEVGLRFRTYAGGPVWELKEVHGGGTFTAFLKSDPTTEQMMTTRAIQECLNQPYAGGSSLRCVHCSNDALPGKELCAICDEGEELA